MSNDDSDDDVTCQVMGSVSLGDRVWSVAVSSNNRCVSVSITGVSQFYSTGVSQF